MATVDIYRPIKTPVNIGLDVAPRTEAYDPYNTEETGSLIARSVDDWKNLAMCKQATTEVATENDPEDAFDAVALKRVRMENPTVTTRTTTYDMERQTVLYAAIFNGIANPMSDETLTALASGEGVQLGGTTDPKVPVCVRERAYDDKQNLLWTRYMYGYLINAGSQTYDGKISRPQLQVEEESSPHNKIVFSPFYLGTASA
ncbi:MAG: hypothetical protein IJZ39_12460 [Oscillospiraceae bacterium]|nr:hypothetical protein [Oscillospiraceae bacterium]